MQPGPGPAWPAVQPARQQILTAHIPRSFQAAEPYLPLPDKNCGQTASHRFCRQRRFHWNPAQNGRLLPQKEEDRPRYGIGIKMIFFQGKNVRHAEIRIFGIRPIYDFQITVIFPYKEYRAVTVIHPQQIPYIFGNRFGSEHG